jgi:hypothetical protein
MALRLCRRHRKECEAGHLEDFKSGEFEEGRRGWKRCGYPIHASGSIRGRFKRQSTGQWEWGAARAISTQWESTETWCELPLVEAPALYLPATAQVAVPTIPEATEAFLSKCETRGLRRTTLAKYCTFTNQLNAYAANRGYIRIDQLSVLDMDRFYASWTDAIRSRAKKLERLKSFIQFCKKRNWLTDDIAEDLDAPHGASVTMPKAPNSDEEIFWPRREVLLMLKSRKRSISIQPWFSFVVMEKPKNFRYFKSDAVSIAILLNVLAPASKLSSTLSSSSINSTQGLSLSRARMSGPGRRRSRPLRFACNSRQLLFCPFENSM